MKLLIVDDSKAVHSFIKEALSIEDGEVRDAFDGAEALEVLSREADFKAILLDWEMPKLTGIQTLRELRRRGIRIPVLMVTSLNDAGRIAEAVEAGANDYIMKPFTREILRAKLANVVEERLDDHA